jgi:hypothetical protein
MTTGVRGWIPAVRQMMILIRFEVHVIKGGLLYWGFDIHL